MIKIGVALVLEVVEERIQMAKVISRDGLELYMHEMLGVHQRDCYNWPFSPDGHFPICAEVGRLAL